MKKSELRKLIRETITSLVNENNYVVVSIHPKGGGYVMTAPTSKSKAQNYASKFPSPKGEKQSVMSVDAARKVKNLVGSEILDEAIESGWCGSISERLKKFKSEMELGQGRKGVYFLHSVGMDTNGNWSYMVSRGANRPKKIQHQGNWAEKIRKDDTESDITDSKTAKQIIDYYESYIKESANLVSEVRVEGREEYEGIKFNVMHQPPKGYFIKGTGSEGTEVFGKVRPKYFDKYDDAVEHAELEIEGYLDK